MILMTIIELYQALQPLIQVLGTITLIVLIAGGTIFALGWIIKKTWKYILALGAFAFVLFTVVLVFGAM